MFLNVHLIRKADDYALQRCEVAEVVEISHDEFNELKCNPLKDYSFIAENKDKLEYENVSTVPCIMFLDTQDSCADSDSILRWMIITEICRAL